MATFAEFIASLDQDVGKRGRQFEHFVKWFLLNDPEWSTQVDQIWLWEEYPERWGADCGIDLVFRHKGGEVWAVQAKCYSQQHDITKHDVDKFLSESNRKGIDKRLLVATTDRIGGNAKQVCEAQEKKVIRYLLSNFETANIEYPASIGDLHSAKRKPKPAPREHQLEAIEGVVLGFERADRCQLIMACGTGKTFTTLWIKERLDAESTLILLPSLGLLSQTLHEWTLAANLQFDVLCVCSDESVGKKGADEAIHAVTDVAFPVTSDVDDIRKFLCRDGMKVVFSTYQSSALVAEAQSVSTVPDFALAIADEAHRCAGKVGNDFTTILDAQRIRARKRLFATATPRTYSTNVKKAAGERGIDVVGMDDEAVFGSVSYSLPFGEAIKRGLLTDYQVVIVGVDNPTIAAWIENRELLKTESGIESDAESLAAQIGLLKAYKDYDLHRVISFHSRVKRAEQFSKDLIDVAGWVSDQHKPSGLMKTDYVSGEMPTDKRRLKLSQLKSLAPGERGLLTNARCLSEGVDVPSLDGVAFIDPRGSQIDIIQAVGRAIRLNKDKSTGTIILPVFIESGADAESSIEDSNFEPIWGVLNALKAHDDVLSAELDQLRTEMGRKGTSKVDAEALNKIEIDLPATVDESFGEAIRTYLVEKVTSTWNFWYGLLQQFVAEESHAVVPNGYVTAKGFALGTWVNNQRSYKDILPRDRRAKLGLLPGWVWSAHDAQWEAGYRQLKEYCQANGDCLVPLKNKTTNGYALGSWVGSQRQNHDSISAERKSRLEDLKGWSWAPQDLQWEAGFRNMKEYSESHGDCAVERKQILPNGFAIGVWVTSQRQNEANILPERKSRLEALLGWTWNQRDEAWEVGFRHLRQYVEANGTSKVPNQLVLPDGYKLGSWLGQQRSMQAKISIARKARLESLPGWTWNTQNEAWETGFQHLLDFRAKYGIAAIGQTFKLPNGYALGNWVRTQRAQKEKLNEEQKARLSALEGWVWDQLESTWEAGFQYLLNYQKEHGDCFVPQTYTLPNGFLLGQWVGRQRKQRLKMSSDRRERLDELAGWVWNRFESAWETAFAHLSDYSAIHGNCAVPFNYKLENGYSLGNWVAKQRTEMGKISIEQKVRLEALRGWVWKVKQND